KSYFTKNAPFGRAQRASSFEEMRIHLFERRTRGEVHQRKCHHGCCNHGGGPGKNDAGVELQQKLSKGAISSEEKQKEKADHRRRKGQRQEEDYVHKCNGWPSSAL